MGCLSAATAPAQCSPQQLQKLLASDGAAGDKFGFSVAFDGTTAVAGSFGHGHAAPCAGAAYVFARSGRLWIETTELRGSGTDVGDHFGNAVDVDGDTIVVGAREDDPVAGNSGAAYVFVRQGSSWVEQQKIFPADGASTDLFGYAVALDGDTLAVGAKGVLAETGAVYVWVRSGGVWTQQQKLEASDGQSRDGFGWSVALEDETLVTGAIGDDDQGDRAGAAYVFTRAGSTWIERQKLFGSDAAASQNFGKSMAMQAGTLLIGTPGASDFGQASGAAYVFAGSFGSWKETQKLLAIDGRTNAQFGEDVALDGNIAVVGAWNDSAYSSATGSAYVYTRNLATWSHSVKLIADDAQPSDNFGGALGLRDGTVFAGAQNTDDQGDNSGACYVFGVDPAGWSRYGTGWPGTYGAPDIALDRMPSIGASLNVLATNSRGQATMAALVFGTGAISVPTPLAGTLLVTPDLTLNAVLPTAGIQAPLSIPLEGSLCGVSLFVQVLEVDPGASAGVSFTQGLQMDIGQ
ncbi:MAG: FG-GAP repeat protein [Planctomycetota bacterium]